MTILRKCLGEHKKYMQKIKGNEEDDKSNINENTRKGCLKTVVQQENEK